MRRKTQQFGQEAMDVRFADEMIVVQHHGKPFINFIQRVGQFACHGQERGSGAVLRSDSNIVHHIGKQACDRGQEVVDKDTDLVVARVERQPCTL